MRHGVVHQVVQQFVQQRRVAGDPHLLLRFQRQRHAARVGQRCQRHALLASQPGEVEGLAATLSDGIGTALDARQRKKAIGQTGQTVCTFHRVRQRLTPGLCFLLTQTQLQTSLERGQRGA
ncbi:hypothetical protein D9M71_721070 [compost metagenome]